MNFMIRNEMTKMWTRLFCTDRNRNIIFGLFIKHQDSKQNNSLEMLFNNLTLIN